MRRSVLFIPGNTPSMLQNYDIFEADAVIIDLEDAVSPAEKDAARELVTQFLCNAEKRNLEIVIRINGNDTDEYSDDLLLLKTGMVDTLMIPKATLKEMKNVIKDIEKVTKQLDVRMPKLLPIIETARAIYDIEAIAELTGVDGILLGAEDLATNLEIKRSEEGIELLYIRNRIAIACRVNKIDAIDTPYVDVLNEEGLRKDCATARQLAMNAKACIHPNQVAIVNEEFAPTEADINYAKRVLIAVEKTKSGAFSLDGKMIDKPIIERAKRTLDKAEKYKLV